MKTSTIPGFNFLRSPEAEGAGGGAAAGAAAGANTGGDAGGNTAGSTVGANNNSGAGAGNTGAAAGGNTGAATGDAAAAAAAAAKKGGDTILAGAGDGQAKQPPADWPADWRQKGMVAAGLPADDKKTLAMLERLTSPGDLVKKVLEQEKIISQGKHKEPLAKDATPEQLAAYRQANGIPETADKYDITLPDGMVIGEDDKPIINQMLGAMHAENLNNQQVKSVLTAYYAQEKQFLQARDADISKNKTTQDDALHAEWGTEYRANLNAVKALNNTFSEDTRNALAGALDGDGYPLLNNKNFLKDLALLARTVNPIDTVVSSGGGNQASSVADEMKAIEGRMGGVDPTYYKDEKAQERYRQLVAWTENQKK